MQRVIIALGDPVESGGIQQIIKSLSAPGILSGMVLQAPFPSTVRVSPGVALTDNGVLIVEDEPRDLPFSIGTPSNYTVLYRYQISNNFGGNPASLEIQPGLVNPETLTDGVIVGWIQYNGAPTLDPNRMFRSGPRFKLQRPELSRMNSFDVEYAPFGSKLTLKNYSGPVNPATISEAYSGVEKCPITTLTNASGTLLNANYLFPIRVPAEGLGKILAEFQVDNGASCTINVLDGADNSTLFTGGVNFFTSVGWAERQLYVPYLAGLTPNSKAFIQLSLQLGASKSFRLKALGYSSYAEPF